MIEATPVNYQLQARLTLARALYSHASILLLDDVLAALDVHTGKWIVEKALRGDLIEGRTTLLVTHNIALVAPITAHVVLLGASGCVVAQGTISEVLKQDQRLRDQLEKDIEVVEKTEVVDEDKLRTESKRAAGKLVIAEEKAMGRVERAATMLYVNGMGGPSVLAFLLGLVWVKTLVEISTTWFMGHWSSQYEISAPSGPPVLA